MTMNFVLILGFPLYLVIFLCIYKLL